MRSGRRTRLVLLLVALLDRGVNERELLLLVDAGGVGVHVDVPAIGDLERTREGHAIDDIGIDARHLVVSPALVERDADLTKVARDRALDVAFTVIAFLQRNDGNCRARHCNPFRSG